MSVTPYNFHTIGNLGLPTNVCPAFDFNPIQAQFNNPYEQCTEEYYRESYREYTNIVSCLEMKKCDLDDFDYIDPLVLEIWIKKLFLNKEDQEMFKSLIPNGLTLNRLSQILSRNIGVDDTNIVERYFTALNYVQGLNFDKPINIKFDKFNMQKIPYFLHAAVWDFYESLSNHKLDEFLKDENEKCFGSPENPFALITTSDGNESPGHFFNKETFKSFSEVLFYGELSKRYYFCYEKIKSIAQMCSQIQRYASSKKIELLVVSAHSSSGHMSFGKSSNNFFTSTPFPTEKCLDYLEPGATIILHGCSTGKEREFSYNIANHFSNNAPKDVRIYSAVKPITGIKVTSFNPLKVNLYNFDNTKGFLAESFEDLTYYIDSSRKDIHCPEGKVSFLHFCNSFPLFKVVNKCNDAVCHQLQFYSAKTKKWGDLEPDTLQFLRAHNFSNKELEKISEEFIDINSLVNTQINHLIDNSFVPESISALELTKKLIEANRKQKENVEVFCHPTLFRNSNDQNPIRTSDDIDIGVGIDFFHSWSSNWHPIDLNTRNRILFSGRPFEILKEASLSKYSPGSFFAAASQFSDLSGEELITNINEYLNNWDFFKGNFYPYSIFPHGHTDANPETLKLDVQKSQENEKRRVELFSKDNICIRGIDSLIHKISSFTIRCFSNGKVETLEDL